MARSAVTIEPADLVPMLGPFLPRQRWYSGTEEPDTLKLVQAEVLRSTPPGLVQLVVEADHAQYQVLVGLRPADEVAELLEGADDSVVGQLRGRQGPITAYDAALDPELAMTLLDTVTAGAESATRVRPMGAEQSNTSLVYDERLVLKVFRRLHPGPNPEVEVPRGLWAAGFTQVPQALASWRQPVDGAETDLAVLQPYLMGGAEGWALALTSLRDLYATGEAPLPSSEPAPPADPGAAGGDFYGEARRLGEMTADLHLALAEAFGRHPGSGDTWADAIETQLSRVYHPELDRRPILELIGSVRSVGDPGPAIRVHGDYHLGQVMRTDAGWYVLDFEGEPARPLEERRRASSPLRDVAGMLRSLHYASMVALTEREEPVGDRAEAWESRNRRGFLDGYLRRAEQGGILPGDEVSREIVLAGFELEKALYELGYEQAHRPDWVEIPLSALRRLTVDRRSPRRTRRQRPSQGGAPAAPGSSDSLASDVASLVAGHHLDPHRLLGPHAEDDGVVVRGWRPDAVAMAMVLDGDLVVDMKRVHEAGLFEAEVPEHGQRQGEWGVEVDDYRLRVLYDDGTTFTIEDPYRFWPTLGELDLHLFGEGRHEGLWRHLGAHARQHQGVDGTSFAVWAPAARSVRVVGDFNAWDGRIHPMRMMGTSGVWELFVPGVEPGQRYKFEIVDANGRIILKADPFAFATEIPYGTASVVHRPAYHWGDDGWVQERARTDPLQRPMSVYECHLGSWRRKPKEGVGDEPEGDESWRALTYRELAAELPAYVADMGFTHVELMPVAEHPFIGSWGYQVTGYYAPTGRHGTPDDFRALVDAFHAHGIGVIVDWVPGHFPNDEWALARFDGTALYEHDDPRQGYHPDWGTCVFNFGRHEVRNFLLANALFWIEEFHIDGLRVDAVASMLYLDYSRKPGEWVPNQFGGRENLEAISFLKELNEVVYRRYPGVVTVAEESTAWPAVSRPTYLGGLGFGMKWNMGWMHDTLEYFSKDPVYRRHHHHQLTFGLVYAFSENFVLPLSHDEVVHGKGSLINKMPGDRGQQFANLRALLAWMWAHPGRQMLFMGGEVAQEREWSHDRSIDWHLLEDPEHLGVQELVRALNRISLDEPALWERDFDPSGFAWIDANDADQNVLSFARFSGDGRNVLACVANLSAATHVGYRVGLPRAGCWREVLNTHGPSPEAAEGPPERWTEDFPWHGHPQSVSLDLNPLSVVWLAAVS